MSVVSVRHLSKEFKLGTQPQGYRTFKELFRRNRSGPERAAITRFVALNDVSFEVEKGEVFGIIGRNGAGKSTLLKILSCILRPTRGRVELKGRVGSLLEVGAGFHPELTGRENIFLNAAILGLKHSEIVRKFDEIVAFSGVEKHLDEPVKHYSSGMYMRLAFAVAAHIEPEILLIDEVLAVGDADFQKKSIQRVEQIGQHGQTVLLVSHNIQTVLRLCRRALLLDQGRVVKIGSAAEVTASYLEIGDANRGSRRYAESAYAPGDNVVRLRGVRVRGLDGEICGTVDIGRQFGIEIEFEVLEGGAVLFPSLIVRSERWPVLWATDAGSSWHGCPRPAGRYTETAWVPANLLSEGVLRVTVGVHSFRPYCDHFVEPDAVVFHAVETSGGARGHYTGNIEGAVRPLLRWTVEHE
jgi:lipopolysaccharide transport system ATP-binding protein